MNWKPHINKEKMVAWRRHLHKYPELAFQEKETSAYIIKALEAMPGIEIICPPGTTSVIGVLKGAKPGKVVGVRADIDALAIQEEADVVFKSVNPGIMHACGHDIHTATVLGVADVFSKIQSELHGTVKFIFQAAEEQFPGGAKEIVESGMVSDCDYFMGAHVLANLKTGLISCWPGPVTAFPDKFSITVTGKSGHGAAPETAIDVVSVGAHIVTNLNSIVSRNISPHDSAVVSVTRFVADSSLNILGATATLGGTIRAKDAGVQSFIHKRMDEVVSGICKAYGANYELEIVGGYRPIYNDEYLTSIVQETVKELYGAQTLVRPRVIMAGDDYSAFLQIAPQVFFLIGSGSAEEGYEYAVHNAKYIASEDILPIGCEMFIACTLKLLANQ